MIVYRTDVPAAAEEWSRNNYPRACRFDYVRL